MSVQLGQIGWADYSDTTDAADWDGWYAKRKDRIVFIESTGFWWQEDPRILENEGKTEVPW